MAITNNGTKISVPASKIPSGYTKPTITTVSGDELWVNNTSFTVLKSTVENASAVTGFTNLVTEVNTAANNLVTDTFDATEDVTFYTNFTNVDDYTVADGDDEAYQNTAEAFDCAVTIYVQVIDVT